MPKAPIGTPPPIALPSVDHVRLQPICNTEGLAGRITLDFALGREAVPAQLARWGNKWGNMPHRSQPIPADLDFVKTALDRALHSPAGPQARAHNPKVAGTNPAPAMDEFRDRPSGGRFISGVRKSLLSRALSSKACPALS